MAYEILADVYDKLMNEDIDYEKWANYCQNLFNEYGNGENTLLDLGCGTGSITVPLALRGYKATGIDISEEMLMRADEKAKLAKVDVDFLCEDITKMYLSQKYDCVLATFDTINYVTNKKQLEKLFKSLYSSLNSGGVFVFDINTDYKLRNVLGDNIYSYYSDDVVYIWENQFVEEEKICYMDLTFFIKDEASKMYKRFEENHKERAYSLLEIKRLLLSAGFTFINAFKELSSVVVENEDEEDRIFIVAKK